MRSLRKHYATCVLGIHHLAMQLDESTLPGNELLLLAYVRFVKRERLVQELLFARQLEADKKRGGGSFFVLLRTTSKKNTFHLQTFLLVEQTLETLRLVCLRYTV